MKKLIAVILSLSLLLSLSGCVIDVSYWNGMSKQETEELILSKLEEKYNEEFEILETYLYYSGGHMSGACSPKSDEELVFEIELWKSGSFYDTYIQSIVRREMKEAIDSVLSKHYDNFASEVYVYGLANAYDSGIRSADEASIKTFTEALPEDNSSIIWIAFDENEIEKDYKSVEPFLAEIVKSFELANAGIECYFVSDETIEALQTSIDNHHMDSGFNTHADTEAILSSKRPIYIYYYKGSSYGLKYVRTARSSGSQHYEVQEAN